MRNAVLIPGIISSCRQAHYRETLLQERDGEGEREIETSRAQEKNKQLKPTDEADNTDAVKWQDNNALSNGRTIMLSQASICGKTLFGQSRKFNLRGFDL